METNLEGLLNDLKLPKNKALIPLFEAIANSLDAIDECEDGCENHQIIINFLANNDLITTPSENNRFSIIDGFSVSDTGMGLNAKNYQAFNEAYTRRKIDLGGKGVGRFMYLKVFDKVEVESYYKEDNQYLLRKFKFNRQGISREPLDYNCKINTRKTTITINRIKDEYRNYWQKELAVFAEEIIQHFFIRFIFNKYPKIFLKHFKGGSIELTEEFKENLLFQTSERNFDFDNYSFSILIHKQQKYTKQEYTFCASGREVEKHELKSLLPYFPEKFTDNQGADYYVKIYISGKYFDDRVERERIDILFKAADDNDTTCINRDDFENKLRMELLNEFQEQLKDINESKIKRIQEFVKNEAPEYIFLLHEKYRTRLENETSPYADNTKLEIQLLHIRRSIEDTVREKGKNIEAKMDTVAYEEYKKELDEYIENINDIGKADLARYVVHRKIIIDLFEKNLKIRKSGNKDGDSYQLESVLHNMIFPMGKTSRDIFLEQQNLWMIDERLSFHSILTSNKKLKTIEGLNSASDKAPDILINFYDSRVGLSEVSESGTNQSGSIVIIEFKRPGRDDYKHQDSSRNPCLQLVQYILQIRDGKEVSIDGRPIKMDNLRFYAFLIADITPSLEYILKIDYKKMTDNGGYYRYIDNINTYIEVISYDKLLEDAKKRNDILFKKLGLK
ncbi:MAG: ATP-binding protein [Neisseriaceae bacterium]|nr:MAG: ATP-binding protein [Neisseriaceae bacterium]